MRHAAADELWRTTDNIVLAQQLLRHASVGTTQDTLHPTREDLAAGMRAVEELWTTT
jgi:integrase